MSKKICFATHNQGKLKEIQALLKNWEVVSLTDIGCTEDIEETGNTFAENASIKSKYVKDHFQINCFSDDSGLEVEALQGAPGVYSARYAGEPSDSEKNMDKLLNALSDRTNRKAVFKTVISLQIDQKEVFFEGTITGTIRKERSGFKGFGYDPIFQPDGYTITFAEMNTEEKNKISHRGQAVKKLIDYLNKL